MARRNLIVSGARARSIPVFHVDIRLYAIGSDQTDVRRIRRTRKSDGDHDYVGLAQARPKMCVTSLGERGRLLVSAFTRDAHGMIIVVVLSA